MTDTPTPETFVAVADLIKLVIDAKACAKRVDELAKLSAETATAQANLDTAQAVHDQTAAALAAREAAVTERERILTAWEQEACDRGVREKVPFPFDPNLGPGSSSWSGLSRAEYKS
jgi:prophage DNA circulation protein